VLLFLAIVTTLASLVPVLRVARSDPNWALWQL